MELRRFWNVLVVDDEPDVHEVTKFALKREKIFGVPLKLHHVASTAEAKEFFLYDDAANALAVALVDVVMESDEAGLELCQWIRDERREHVTQLILRTGQPGKAPPRSIIDGYNISGYLTKLEATGDRLYMMLTTAIQQYYNLQYLFWSAELSDAARNRAEGALELFEFLKQIMSQPAPEVLGVEFHRGLELGGGRYLGQGEFLERSVYDKIKAEVMPSAADQLEQNNGVARVGDYVVVQTRIVGSGVIPTMIIKNPTCPRALYSLYGPVWRQNLAYMAEVFSKM